MRRYFDIFLTALAPSIWGSSYIIITTYLPDDYPLSSAAIRALPAGILLLLISPKLPKGIWWWRVLVLGALNFSIFWWLLFVAAYRLPGGVAATLGAIQPLIVVFAAALILNTKIRSRSILAGFLGMLGVALLVLTVEAQFDILGITAAVVGATSMAFGVVLTRKWQPDEPLLRFASWQLISGGLLLSPFAILFEHDFPSPTLNHMIGYTYLSLIGGAFTYLLWFRGIKRLDPNIVSPLGFLSPFTAVILGWAFLDQTLTLIQVMGIMLVLLSLWMATRQNNRNE